MVIYEVNLSVQPDAAEGYGVWLPEHIRQMLSLEGFLGAQWSERVDEPGDVRQWTIHYYVRNMESLDRYFAEHAAEMRRDGLERFPGKFTATRRVLNRIEEFSAG